MNYTWRFQPVLAAYSSAKMCREEPGWGVLGLLKQLAGPCLSGQGLTSSGVDWCGSSMYFDILVW